MLKAPHWMMWTALAALLAGCGNSAGGGAAGSGAGGSPTVLRCATARIASAADLLPGPIARGTVGDLVIENAQFRAIIQKGGRNWYSISQFGGNIIDALPKAADGSLLGQDHFEEFALGTNIESSPNYQTVEVINAGGARADGSCEPAVIRASGTGGNGADDDLMDFINGSTAIRGVQLGPINLFYPPSADDVDLPIRFTTTYTLDNTASYIRIDTLMQNQSASPQNIYLVEYANGSGEVEAFQHGYGFGEAFATGPCTQCNYLAYAGHEGGKGVSYGIIFDFANTTTVSVSGVSVLLYGRDILNVATANEATYQTAPTSQPNFRLAANGSLTATRYFAVGNGTVSSIVDARNTIFGLTTGTIQGTVTDANGPVADAEIVMISSGTDGFTPAHRPQTNVVNHFRTDSTGRYSGTYAAGSYELRINVPGRLAPTPATANITVTAGATTTQNFTAPVSTGLRVLVRDGSNNPLPAKVQLVGARLGPDGGEPLNQDQISGNNALGIFTGFFGDPGADPLPPGIALTEFSVFDTGSGTVTVGDTGVMPIEPGSYQLSVSHGSRYNHVQQAVTIPASGVREVTVTLQEVVPTPNHIFGDFHVHAVNSPDSEVSNRERLITYLAEGLDFFTPSDHDNRVDFSPFISDMGIASRIATAPSAEVTTFDYGHYIFWPLQIETNSPNDDFPNAGHSIAPKIAKGSTDWGGQAPYGQDFPSSGQFSLTPAQIYASAELDPLQSGRRIVKQINHIDWHFGTSNGGLGINTGVNPPQSSTAGTARRLNPAVTNYYDDNYDSLELLIGADGLIYDDHFYDENLGDWFNLLNQGRMRTGMANSDTHQRRVTGMHTRNQISVPAGLLNSTRANPSAISADPHTVADQVRTGRSTMTNAPFLIVKARNASSQIGGLETTDAFGPISAPLPGSGGDITLDITVKSPQWAPYDQILVFVNGHTVRQTNELGIATTPPRYKLCAPATGRRFDLGSSGFVRNSIGTSHFETTKSVTLPNPGSDYWIVVMVRGTNGQSPSLWPVVPDSFEDGADNIPGNVDDVGLRALAVSNPIFVDVNGGSWTPPGVNTTTHTGAILPPDACPTGAMPAR